MKRYMKSLIAMVLFSILAGCGSDAPKSGSEGAAAGPSSGDVSYFFGARIIPGDGSPVLEDTAFIVTGGKFSTIGKRSEVVAPKGAARIELTGRTVIPVFINLQAQPGMNNGAKYGSKNYSRDTVTADLARYLYYGVYAVMSAGTDAGDLAISVRDEIRQGKVKGAQLLTAGRGIAAKGGGPATLAETTIQVSGATDAKNAVKDLAGTKVDAIKLWMDDGNGKGAKLKPEAYAAVIEEAHKNKLKVVAEVFDLADAKDLVKAGIDGFVNSIRDKEVDDALISAMKEKNVFLAPALTANEAKFIYADKPDWLGEQTMREVYPAKLAGYLADPISVNRFKRLPDLGALRQQYDTAMKNLKKLSAGGVKIALGTNSGAADTYPGYFELREMIMMADAGMAPMDVIKASTSVPAAIMGLTDLGTIAVGKAGNFLSMPNSPLEKMVNIKDVGQLYINGSEQERTPLIQNITIPTEILTITKADRQKDLDEQNRIDKEAREAKMTHYGKLAFLKSVPVRSVPVPTPLDSKAEVKAGPPDKITVQVKASAADLKEFYAKALVAYHWTPAGACYEKESPARRACVEASNGMAVITITDK